MRSVELHFPNQGVNRRLAERRTEKRGSYPAPWAVNVRLDCNLDRRLRGGSRPGLTSFVTGNFGSVIASIISVTVSNSSGAKEIVMVLVDGVIKTTVGGTATIGTMQIGSTFVVGPGIVTPGGYLTDDDGNILTDDDGNQILASSVAAPSTGYLVAGKQQAFAVGPSAVSQINPVTGQVDHIAAKGGTVPTGTTFGAVYRDRLFLGGNDNIVHSSGQGDYADWDYGKDVGNQGRAIAFQLSLGGDVGPLITALIPHKDSTMLLASVASLWVLRGDPASGKLERVSENTGIVSSDAWCKADDTFYFLSKTGVFQVGADGSNLSRLSEDSLPDELRGVNTTTTNVQMGYEVDRNALHVFLTTAGGSDNHFVYEITTKTWWVVRLQSGHSPKSITNHKGNLLLAGVDGGVRQIGGDDDAGTPISSHVVIGPIKLGSIDRTGIANMLHGVLAQGSGTVTWRIVTGTTAEEAADNAKLAIEAFQAATSYAAYVKATGTWTAGRSLAQYPRVGSPWICLWLESSETWSYEGGTMQVKLSGRYR